MILIIRCFSNDWQLATINVQYAQLFLIVIVFLTVIICRIQVIGVKTRFTMVNELHVRISFQETAPEK